ncbi:MAG: ferrochelatase [Chitinophagaceae bacterium]|nr:ferrochelatase [Chitinophagaceae bacterium]
MSASAILLMNLGSPDSPTAKALRPYLSEFLMDERVIDLPLLTRTLLVKGIIVPFRAAKSAAKYKTIWTDDGSPLLIHTQRLRNMLQQRFEAPVYYSMRYGNPATGLVLHTIQKENSDLKELIVLPLYPHYAMSSYETAVEQVKHEYKKSGFRFELKVVPPFYRHPLYISALAESIRPYLEKPFDHLLFSYHGIPERHIYKSDCSGLHCLRSADCCTKEFDAHGFCYRHQIITTTELVAAQLGLNKSRYSFSFQSRLGRDAWLKPYTSRQLNAFPGQGIKRLLVVCPAFISDCLETLEEIDREGREDFLRAGGEYYEMIPALNEDVAWLDCAATLINEQQTAVVSYSV